MYSDWLRQKQDTSQGPERMGTMIGSLLLNNLVTSVERTFPPVKEFLLPEGKGKRAAADVLYKVFETNQHPS